VLNGSLVIDADGHVNDWHVDWPALLPPELRGFAPRSLRDAQGFPRLEAEGRLLPEEIPDLDYSDVGAAMAALTRDGKYWLPRRGEEDPLARLPDMDEMGIDVAVLFGGHSFLVAAIVESPQIALATLRAYNQHLAGYCAAAPERLKGVAMLPLQAPREAADELRRCVGELGFVAGVLPPHHAGGRTLDDASLAPIWRAAEALRVPICIHTIGIQINPARVLAAQYRMREAYGSLSSQLALGSLVLGGVLDRHPELRVAFLEAGAGWVPHVIERLQGAWSSFSFRREAAGRAPEQVLRGGQLYFATEPDEALLPAVAAIVGEERLVLGSDYCHPEGQCPYTMKTLAARSDLTPAQKRKILCENPARLYGLAAGTPP